MRSPASFRWFAALGVSLLALGGCPGEDPVPNPEITDFSASASEITEGDEVTLSWQTTAAVEVAVETDAGEAIDLGDAGIAAGSVTLAPAATATYTLTATGAEGSTPATAEVTVTVLPPPVPAITSFTATPDAILVGETSTLAWETANVDAVVLTDAAGNAIDLSGAEAASGSVDVAPTADETYTLTATGRGGETTATATVTVTPLPVVDAFTVSPDTVELPGTEFTLAWETTDADHVVVTDDAGNTVVDTDADLDGTVAVTPAVTTDYTLTATGPGGTAEAVTVTASVLPVIGTFSATPDTVRTGDTVELSWATQGATAGAIASGDGFTYDIPAVELAAGSTTATVTATGTVDFVLTVGSRDLEMTETATVTVTDAPRIRAFAATPAEVTAEPGTPAPVTLAWTVDGADSLSLTSDVTGPVDVSGLPADAGQVKLSVEETQTFTLTAVNATGEHVLTALVTAVAPPAIDAFAALPAVAGAGESVTLSWQTTNAVSVTLEKGPVALGVDPSLVDGSYVDGPLAAEETYVLRAANALSAETTRTLTVSVGSPVVASFGPAASVIQSGDTTHLEWEILGGTSLAVTDGAGNPVAGCGTADLATIASGSCAVTPLATETFTLTVANASGETTATAEVVVTDGPVIRSFTSAETLVTVGNGFIVEWVVDNDAAGTVPTLTLTDDQGNSYDLAGADANLGSIGVTLATAGDYVLTLTASTDGTTADSATLAVTAVAEPQILAFAADPAVLDTQGGTVQPTSTLSWTTQDATALALYALDASGTPVSPALFEATTQAEVDAHQFTVSPADSTDYQLVAENAAGDMIVANLRVAVDIPEVATFTGTLADGTVGTDLNVLAGESVTLDWNILRANRAAFMPADPVMTEIGSSFVDISTSPTATQVAMSGSDDSGSGVIAFRDFPVPFYGEMRSEAVVFTDGYLSFDINASRSSYNDSFPDTGTPDGTIVAPFWDDLDAEGTGTIWTDTGSDASGRYVVVMWKNYQFYSSSARPADLNFEVFMYEDGRIVFAYGTMTSADQERADGDQASYGFENDEGTMGAEIKARNTVFAAPGLSNRAWSFEFPAQATGSLAVTPTEDTTYMVVGVNDNGATSAQVSVGVWTDLSALNPTFSVSPNPAETGDTVSLSWSVTGANAAQVTLNGQPVDGCASQAAAGEHRTSGSCEVANHAEGAFDYVLEFTNPVSAGTKTVTLNVYPPLAITSFVTSSEFIAGGESVTVSWTATPVASQVNLRANGVVVTTTETATGDSYTATLTETTLFELAVGDPNGRWVYDQLTVYVDAARVDSTTVGDAQIPQGGQTTIGWTTTNATDGVTTTPYTPDVQQTTAAFEDISVSGTAQELVMSSETSADEAVLLFPGGFRFPFYGTDRTQALIQTSGRILFDINESYPDVSAYYEVPNSAWAAFIAPFWASQELRDTGEIERGSIWYEVRFTGTQRVLIIQWKDLQFSQSTRNPSSLNYQVWMYEDGTFEFRYGTMDAATDTDTGTSYADGHFFTTAAYQNDDGTVGFTLHQDMGDDNAFPGGFANRSFKFRNQHLASDTHSVSPTETTTYQVCATGGGWTDCEDVTVVVISPGDVLFTELMVNPAAVTDDVGEWFELRNVAPYPIDLAGWTVSDGEDTFTVPATAPYIVQPGQHVVFAKGDATVNGGIQADFVYGADAPNLSLAQGGDELTLTYAGIVIDEVAYDTSAGWTVTSGVSMYLDPSWNMQDASANDAYATATDAVWCASTTPIGTSTDLGNPGTRGEGCRFSGTGYQVDMAGANWIDISATGTEIPWTDEDDDYAAVPGGLGFTVPFFTETYSDLFVSTNGWVSFIDPTDNNNYNPYGALPDSGEPGALVAAFWDSWGAQVDGSTAAYWERRLVDGANVMIVQWNDVRPRSYYEGNITFQVQVWETGDIGIVIHQTVATEDSSYAEDYCMGDGATIAGIQNFDGTLGMQYADNEPVLKLGKIDQLRLMYVKE